MKNEYPNSKLDKSDPLREQIQIQPEETGEQSYLDGDENYGGWEGAWAGDGSGLDDLADFNQMEGQDC